MEDNTTKDEKKIDDKEETVEECVEKNDNISNIKDYINSESDDYLKKIEELTNILQRTQADFLNYKRRTEEEKKVISIFANEKILEELIIVIDNFDRALSQENVNNNSFVEGISLIRKQLFSILEKNDISEIDTTIKFNPNMHYAVMQEETGESDNILEVLQKGYLIKNKVLRPAMVKVSK